MVKFCLCGVGFLKILKALGWNFILMANLDAAISCCIIALLPILCSYYVYLALLFTWPYGKTAQRSELAEKKVFCF